MAIPLLTMCALLEPMKLLRLLLYDVSVLPFRFLLEAVLLFKKVAESCILSVGKVTIKCVLHGTSHRTQVPTSLLC